MAVSNSRLELALRAFVMVLLAILTAAFWRWADVVHQGVQTLGEGQTEILVKIAELEGKVALTAAVQAAEIDHLRERVERLENPGMEGPP